jgi:hypothetical protein
MPFVYDESEIEWPEDDDDFELPPPRPDQFVYIPPPELGGAPESVRFLVDESAAATGTDQTPQAAEGALSAPGETPRSYEEVRRQHERRAAEARQRLFAFAVPELRKVGVRRLYCRYDGGNDEGFSWLESIETADGARLDADALAQRLHDAQLTEKLCAAGMMHRSSRRSDREMADEFVRLWLSNEWASMLLGDSYGTGPYSMYGAFTVDLEACTVSDDRNADPIVHNIRIATGSRSI